MRLVDIENINLEESARERSIHKFNNVINKFRSGKFSFVDDKVGEIIVVNEARMGSHFIHVVHESLLSLFNELRKNYPDDFLGFSVLVGKHNGREVRVSCFGVPCSELTNILIR